MIYYFSSYNINNYDLINFLYKTLFNSFLELGQESFKSKKYIKEGLTNMTDKTLTCKDCNSEFIFTEGEQAFYKEKGFENEPQRCPDCRKARKQKRNNDRNNGFNKRW
jgi:hypothetical protein